MCFTKGYKRCYKIKPAICLLNKAHHKICHCCFANVSYYKSRISIVYVKLTSNTVFWHAQINRKDIVNLFFKVLIKAFINISSPIMGLLFALPEN